MTLHVEDCMKGRRGFACVLRRIRDLTSRGETFDFTDWGVDASALASLDDKELRALILIYQLFYRERQKVLSTRRRSEQEKEQDPLYTTIRDYINTLRRRRNLPDLTVPTVRNVIERWKNREITQDTASEELGIFIETFGKLIKTYGIRKKTPEEWAAEKQEEKEAEYEAFIERVNEVRRTRNQNTEYLTREMFQDIITQWTGKKITKREAAEKLGITTLSLSRFLTRQGIEQQVEPARFPYVYNAWKRNLLSNREAARLCGIGQTSFAQLALQRDPVRMRGIDDKMKQSDAGKPESAEKDRQDQ